MQTGVTAQTWENMIIDSAVVYVDYGLPGETILGATNGGVTFGWDAFNVRSPEIDGIKGRLAGVSRITEASPQITVSLVEWNLTAIKLASPGCTVVEAGGIATITRNTRVIPIGDYPLNIAMVGTQSGTGDPVVILLHRPMVVSGVEIPTEDDSEATADLTFVGHYDPANPEQEPWEIRWPTSDKVNLGPLTLATSEIDDDAADGAVVGGIVGRAEGSTIVSTNPNFSATGDNLVVAVDATLTAGSYTFALVETLAGATGSPRASAVTVTVNAA
jgi:hypothetical protein